jgi:hypothetical protein
MEPEPSRSRYDSTAGEQSAARNLAKLWRVHMPILLWLIGVPISIIVLLMLFGVLHI